MKRLLTDDSHHLQWNMRGKRSKRTASPPPKPTADEYAVADTLLLLATSGGGFCNSTPIAAAVPITILPATEPQQLCSSSSSAASNEEGSPYTPLPEMMNIHACLMCGKAFQSYQALGGHMTCHRIRTENAAVKSTDTGDYECTICHEKFHTGQALGGHKRKHYQGELHPRRAKRVTGEISDRRFTLDLNFPPPPEE